MTDTNIETILAAIRETMRGVPLSAWSDADKTRVVALWLFADRGFTDAKWNDLSDEARGRWDAKAKKLIEIIAGAEPSGTLLWAVSEIRRAIGDDGKAMLSDLPAAVESMRDAWKERAEKAERERDQALREIEIMKRETPEGYVTREEMVDAVEAERKECEAIARVKAGEGERWTAVNQIAFDIADAIAARARAPAPRGEQKGPPDRPQEGRGRSGGHKTQPAV